MCVYIDTQEKTCPRTRQRKSKTSAPNEERQTIGTTQQVNIGVYTNAVERSTAVPQYITAAQQCSSTTRPHSTSRNTHAHAHTPGNYIRPRPLHVNTIPHTAHTRHRAQDTGRAGRPARWSQRCAQRSHGRLRVCRGEGVEERGRQRAQGGRDTMGRSGVRLSTVRCVGALPWMRLFRGGSGVCALYCVCGRFHHRFSTVRVERSRWPRRLAGSSAVASGRCVLAQMCHPCPFVVSRVPCPCPGRCPISGLPFVCIACVCVSCFSACVLLHVRFSTCMCGIACVSVTFGIDMLP